MSTAKPGLLPEQARIWLPVPLPEDCRDLRISFFVHDSVCFFDCGRYFKRLSPAFAEWIALRILAVKQWPCACPAKEKN